MLNHNNLEEVQDPVHYDIEIATEGQKFLAVKNDNLCVIFLA